MNSYTKFFILLILSGAALTAQAQTSSSTSSYSRFGMGLLSDQSQGPNRSMGGVGQALRAGNRVNMLNPASYSAIDSLTFLFDVGMSGERTHLSQGNTSINVNRAGFEYVNAGFRVAPGLGMSVGFAPYTTIGYNFQQQGSPTYDMLGNKLVQQMTYAGSGGLHNAYIGAGWRAFKSLSIGANLGFLWGNITNQSAQTMLVNGSSSSNYYTLTSNYSANIKTWKLDIGLQWQTLLDKQNLLNLGATVGIGHKLPNEATLMRTALNGDTTNYSVSNAYQLPMTYSMGAAWEHKGKLLVAADVTYEQWGKCTTPQLVNATNTYEAQTGQYKDRFRINAGLQYTPAPFDRSIKGRIQYRFGASYSSPYLKVNGQDGPKEMSITAGLGLPIINSINNRSYLNIGLQWAHRDANGAGMIAENTFRINLGLSFNERWFMKWKFK